jgi:FAD/FMN-containing dehydrogenase
MGGQQFAAGAVHVDMSRLGRVLRFDREVGRVEVEAGIQWPELMAWLLDAQPDVPGGRPAWGIVQKPTGADRMSIGGAVAANVHGRGLQRPPFVADVESLEVLDGAGERRRCSRQENSELFRLVVGGYGLFGIVSTVTMRLAPRRKLERVVQTIDVDDVVPAFEQRIKEGYLFGDCQYATDPTGAGFLRLGVFSCYRPLDADAAMGPGRELSRDDWNRLLYFAHADKRRAFTEYAAFYQSTSGQRYWSDTHQLSLYVPDYHRQVEGQTGAPFPGSEIITEIYVPRAALGAFLRDVRRDFRAFDIPLIYGTIRLIERDEETFLAWARERWVCVIFNIHTDHSPQGLTKSESAFRRLIDMAINQGGSYYLTYHRYASRSQVQACYPQFPEFLRLKRRWDPEERFQSEWYRHYRQVFA